jgi:hypothetical protein
MAGEASGQQWTFKIPFHYLAPVIVHPARHKANRHTGMILQRTMRSILRFKHGFAVLPFRIPARHHLAATSPFGFVNDFKGSL